MIASGRKTGRPNPASVFNRKGECPLFLSSKQLTLATTVQVYCCDPQSPWQRGTNSNTNRLLRQYFPHATDLSRYSQAELNGFALRLNQRPRRTFGFQTPAAILEASVRSSVEPTLHVGPIAGSSVPLYPNSSDNVVPYSHSTAGIVFIPTPLMFGTIGISQHLGSIARMNCFDHGICTVSAASRIDTSRPLCRSA